MHGDQSDTYVLTTHIYKHELDMRHTSKCLLPSSSSMRIRSANGMWVYFPKRAARPRSRARADDDDPSPSRELWELVCRPENPRLWRVQRTGVERASGRALHACTWVTLLRSDPARSCLCWCCICACRVLAVPVVVLRAAEAWPRRYVAMRTTTWERRSKRTRPRFYFRRV